MKLLIIISIGAVLVSLHISPLIMSNINTHEAYIGPINLKAAEKKATRKSQIFHVNSIGMKLIRVKSGKFIMGSPENELGRLPILTSPTGVTSKYSQDPEYRHSVKLTKDFFLSTTEVTQKQWQIVMKTTPWKGKQFITLGDDYPAAYVSWWDANEFCVQLGKLENCKYRLPTDAEWEYSCRANENSRFCCGDTIKTLNEYAHYSNNCATKGFQKVGLLKPNQWGFYDMHGNVWEWCFDFKGNYLKGAAVDPYNTKGAERIFRGGSWASCADKCRSAYKSSDIPINRYRSHRCGQFNINIPS